MNDRGRSAGAVTHDQRPCALGRQAELLTPGYLMRADCEIVGTGHILPPLPTILAWATSAALSNGATNDTRSLRSVVSFSFESSLIVPNYVVISYLPRAASPAASVSSK